ncbi:unnamed protein product [Arctogadus glacialis]
MVAEHVFRPWSHQRSLSYALNTSKPRGDETVAFKFYGRCKQGLLTSPGWSAPWSATGGRGGYGPAPALRLLVETTGNLLNAAKETSTKTCPESKERH